MSLNTCPWSREEYTSWEGFKLHWWIAHWHGFRMVVYETVGKPPTPSWKCYRPLTLPTAMSPGKSAESTGWHEVPDLNDAKRQAEDYVRGKVGIGPALCPNCGHVADHEACNGRVE